MLLTENLNIDSQVGLKLSAFDHLIKMMDHAANNEKKFCVDLQLEFERTSWELFRLKTDLEILLERFGG